MFLVLILFSLRDTSKARHSISFRHAWKFVVSQIGSADCELLCSSSSCSTSSKATLNYNHNPSGDGRSCSGNIQSVEANLRYSPYVLGPRDYPVHHYLYCVQTRPWVHYVNGKFLMPSYQRSVRRRPLHIIQSVTSTQV